MRERTIDAYLILTNGHPQPLTHCNIPFQLPISP